MLIGLKAPLQARSEETLTRILEATERLLEDRALESISVAEIVREAPCSNGSFYARFSDKASLLPAIYERYDATVREDMEAWFERCSRPTLSLRELCRNCVDEIVALFSRKKWLLRAVTTYSRTHTTAVPQKTLQHRSKFQERMVEVFLLKSDEIAHPHPEQAVRCGLFAIAATARDGILFNESPHALAAALEVGSMKHELSQMLFANLSTAP